MEQNLSMDYLQIICNLIISKKGIRGQNPWCNGVAEKVIKSLKDILIKDYFNNKKEYNLRFSLEKYFTIIIIKCIIQQS